MKKMLNRMLRPAVLLMVCFLLLPVLAGCAKLKPEDDRTVLTVDGKAVCYDEYYYYFMNSKASLDGGDETYWVHNEEHLNELRDFTLSLIKRNYAIEGVADKYKIELTSDEKKAVRASIQDTKATFENEEAYQKVLDDTFLTEWTLERLQMFEALWQKVYDYVTNEASGVILTDDQALIEDVKQNYYRVQYVYIEDNSVEELESNMALAKEVAERAAAGEDFEALIAAYGEDEAMRDNHDGRYFTDGELTSFFEDAAKALEIGESSGVLDATLGSYIIKRLPIEEEYVLNHLNTLRRSYMARRFNEMVEEYEASIPVETTDLMMSLDVYNID